jgi:hypothetical protein
MSPELAARIESSVTGKHVEPGATLSARARGIARIVVLLLVIAAVWAFIVAKKHDKKTFEHDRTALADSLGEKAHTLGPMQRGAVMRAETILLNFAGTYQGDIAEHGAIAALDRPAMYVRGSIDAFTSTRRIAPAASSSRKDALLLCLIAPPTARTERALLPNVTLAYAGGAALDAKTPNVSRLDDAETALPFFEPAWAARVRGAETEGELALYRHEIEKASLDRGVRALEAEVLIVAMDEPGAPGAVVELDGERAHDVRLAIVELGSGEYIFRMHAHVDPSTWSESGRSQWASGLDGCRLAQDARAAMTRAP